VTLSVRPGHGFRQEVLLAKPSENDRFSTFYEFVDPFSREKTAGGPVPDHQAAENGCLQPDRAGLGKSSERVYDD